MVYEVPQLDYTQEQYEEMKKIVRTQVCAQCGADLTIHTVPERGTLAVGCLNKEHCGYIERETYTEAFRRGMIVHPGIQAAIEKKMMPRSELGRAMNLLALRYPSAIKDTATAALFIFDCARLDLDPLIQPAEAVPVSFKSKKIVGGKEITVYTISMVITEDGWLSMASRGCKEDWNGPPRTMRLEEYLTTLKENEGKTREETQAIAKEIKKSACKDENAWYYVAIGRSKSMTEDAVVPGWFTERDMKKAEEGNLPAHYEPGNQARVRAIKKWVRHVYPECRQRMKEITAEWSQRAEGIKAAQEYIDAEYSFISQPEGDKKPVVPGKPASAAVTTQPGGGVSPSQGGVTGGATSSEAPSTTDKKGGVGEEGAPPVTPPKARTAKGARAVRAEPGAPSTVPLTDSEGFIIERDWLTETMSAIHWTEDTAKSWIKANFPKVDISGDLDQVLHRLNHAQAEKFTSKLNDQADHMQTSLFK